jgi:oligoendopeptidase F
MAKLLTTWDLSALLASDHDPAADTLVAQAQQAYTEFAAKWAPRVDFLTSPSALKEALDDYETLDRLYAGTGAAGYYFWLRAQQDQSDPYLKAQATKLDGIEAKLANQVEFFTNRLCRLPAKTQKLMLGYPELKLYRHFLELLFASAPYTLTESEEKILTLKNQTAFTSWVQMVKEFIGQEEREVLDASGTKTLKTLPDMMSLLSSPKKHVRDVSAQAINAILAKYADTAEHELNAILLDKKITDELRGVARPDKLRHVLDDIDTQVVDGLLNAVTARFDIPQRFYKLKAKLMGVPQLAYHERNVTLGKLAKNYSYTQAVRLVGSTLGALDPEFAQIFHTLASNGNIDVYPAKGKHAGAFAGHKRLTDQPYVLLNYGGKLSDVTTLGHEIGHALNTVFITRNQNSLAGGTPLCTAEVASTLLEDFVFDRIAADYGPQDRLYLLMEKLSDAVASIFRQVACYRFEQELHHTYRAKNYLTKSDIGALFTKHMAAYMGDAVEQSPGATNWWVYWSHIRSFFYVYSYASGLLIAKALHTMVRQDPTSVAKVKKFLAAGTSDSPSKVFMTLGIDISNPKFWHQGLSAIDQVLTEAESLV